MDREELDIKMILERVILYFIIVSLYGLLIGCDLFESESSPPRSLSINNDSESLNSQVHLVKKKVDWEHDDDKKKDYSKYCNLEVRAEVDQPQIPNGTLVDATHVTIKGNIAYVTYNYPGEIFAGGVQAYNISDPETPVLISQVMFDDTDVNAVEVYGNSVWIVGATNTLSGSDHAGFASPAVLEELRMQNNQFQSHVQSVDIPSYSANSVVKTMNKLYVTSGNTGGGLFELPLSNPGYLTIVNSFLNDNSKYLAYKGDEVLRLVSGENAHIDHFEKSESTIVAVDSISLDGINPSDGKSVMFIDSKYLYVAKGDKGLDILSSGAFELAHTFPASTFHEGNTNGVTATSKCIYIANGAGGLYAASELTSSNVPEIIGYWDFNGSANFVEANENYVFLASGSGGLKILKNVDASDDD